MTDNILHLFDGNEDVIGYEVLLEGDDYYDLYYKEGDSKIRVYKSFNSALKKLILMILMVLKIKLFFKRSYK